VGRCAGRGDPRCAAWLLGEGPARDGNPLDLLGSLTYHVETMTSDGCGFARAGRGLGDRAGWRPPDPSIRNRQLLAYPRQDLAAVRGDDDEILDPDPELPR